MSGVKYLLDSNVLIGLLKGNPSALAVLQGLAGTECGFSAISRMELLGYPGITADEQTTLHGLLSRLAYFPVSAEVEDAAIRLRQTRRITLPDAIVAATALSSGLELLTMDDGLKQAMEIWPTGHT